MALLKDENKDVRVLVSHTLGHQSNLLDKILAGMGLFLESERQAELTGSTIYNPEFVECLYGSLLLRSFWDQSSLYVDHHSCIINQPSGLRIVSFKHSRSDHFRSAVRKHRQLWNISGYKLWDRCAGDDAQ